MGKQFSHTTMPDIGRQTDPNLDIENVEIGGGAGLTTTLQLNDRVGFRFAAVLEFSCECYVKSRFEWEKKDADDLEYAPDPPGNRGNVFGDPRDPGVMRVWMESITVEAKNLPRSNFCYIATEDHAVGRYGDQLIGRKWRITGFVEWEHYSAKHVVEVEVVADPNGGGSVLNVI